MPEPLIRRNQTQTSLEELERGWPQLHAQVREALAPSSKSALASSAKWIPLSVDLDLHKCVLEGSDAGVVEEWVYQSFMADMERSLLKPLLEGTRKLLGLNPQHLFAISTRVWDTIYQHCGQARVLERTSSKVVVEHRGLPPDMCAEKYAYVEAFVGTYRAVIDICKMRGDVEITDYDRKEGRAVFDARWAK
mgnify:CR=1 FL=1